MTEVNKPRITVNGVGISQAQIDAEVQYHPASSLFEAQEEAARALVVRELLLQRARKCGLDSGGGRRPEDVIDDLLKKEIQLPVPDDETCRRYYENNRKKFVTTPVYEAAHILFLAPPENEEARIAAQTRSREVLAHLQKHPSDFDKMARELSACPSAQQGGRLGQVGKGDTLPSFEAALAVIDEGDFCSSPVETNVGFHIIRMDRKVQGRELPYEAVREWISDHLAGQSWQNAVRQYIQILAGDADIQGYRIKSAENPLVQ